MFRFLAWLHALLFRVVFWALRLPFRALWATLVAILALLGEEVRRYLGLAMMGLLVFLFGKATLNFAPDSVKLPLVLVTLALVCIWALAVVRAIRFTLGTNLRAVRQRMYFRELAGQVGQLGDRWDGAVEAMATRTRGTRAGRLFPRNREADEQAAREAEAIAARERAAADHEEWLDNLPPDHDPYARR